VPRAAQVVAVNGEAGVGKSRLVEEALRMIRMVVPDARMLWETCQSYEQITPYAIVSRLFRRVLDVSLDDDPAAQAMAVAEQIDQLVPSWSRFTPLLGPLLNLPIPATALTRALSAEQQRDRTYDLLVHTFLAVARHRPLVLVIDDLHWVDASSQAVLQRLIADLSGSLLLLLIYRGSPEFLESWQEFANSSTITLGELSHAESEALLSALLGGICPPELRPMIERSIGTPLFIEEIVRYMLESGALRRDTNGGWEWTRAVDTDAVPLRIEQLITARLDRLSEETRAILQIAAVIGQQVPHDLLAAVSLQPELLERCLDELETAAVFVLDETAAVPVYRFKYGLLRDVAYSSLLFARRKELHEQVALAIEHIYAVDLVDRQAMLAHHYLHAGNMDRAFQHLDKAARQAQARYANSESLMLYQQALAIAPWRDLREDPPAIHQATTLYENMGDLQAITGDYAGARASYDRLLELLKPIAIADRCLRQAALQRKIGSTYENQGDLEQALNCFTRAENTITLAAETNDSRVEHARILSDTGWVYFRQGDMERAQEQLQKALEALGELDVPDEQARILNRIGGVAWSRGEMELARHYVEQSLAASTHSGNLVDQAWALNNLGILTGGQESIDNSIAYSIRAMQLAEQFGSRRMMAMIAINAGCTLFDHKEYQRAKTYFDLALEHATGVRDTYNQMMALLNLGRLYLALGQLDTAEQTARQSQSLATQLQLSAEQLDIYIMLSEIALRRGDSAAATQEYQYALPLATDTESEEYGRFQRLEAQLATLQGRPERAIELLTANEALFIRLHNLPEAARTRALLAQIIEQQQGVATSD
jgi:predicted ATPase